MTHPETHAITPDGGELPFADAAVCASNLVFHYPARRAVPGFELAVSELRIERGERVALHGPSGSGKSTLLNLIAGALVATTGTLWVGGRELRRLDARERRAHRLRTLGFVFQDFPLVDYLSALENVLFPYRLGSALRLDAAARQRARELLDELGLGDFATRRPAELSQGERQRVAIARALVTEPQVLLADEPTAGLDPSQSQAALDRIEALCRAGGRTLVWVTHDPALLDRFERRIGLVPTTAPGGIRITHAG